MESIGKSTCLQLLLRHYESWTGAITINGCSLAEYNTEQLGQYIGVVSQEPVCFVLILHFYIPLLRLSQILFGTSIYENIRYGKEDASRAEIEEAAQEAYAHDFIMQLPNVRTISRSCQ